AAIALRDKRKGEYREGKKLPENLRTVVRVKDLESGILRNYRDKRRKSTATVELRLKKHILPFFGILVDDSVSTDDINAYIDKRRAQEAEDSTIKRELAALRHMYHIASAATPPKVTQIPVFPHLEENDPRKGFIDDEQYDLLAQQTKELWLRAILAVAYTFGLREGELLSLKAGQVDLSEQKISLDPSQTKNGEARDAIMTTEVYQLLSALLA